MLQKSVPGIGFRQRFQKPDLGKDFINRFRVTIPETGSRNGTRQQFQDPVPGNDSRNRNPETGKMWLLGNNNVIQVSAAAVPGTRNQVVYISTVLSWMLACNI